MTPETSQTTGDAPLPASPVTDPAPGHLTPVSGAADGLSEHAPGRPAGPESSNSGPAQTSPPAPATVNHGEAGSLTGAGGGPGSGSSRGPVRDEPGQASAPPVFPPAGGAGSGTAGETRPDAVSPAALSGTAARGTWQRERSDAAARRRLSRTKGRRGRGYWAGANRRMPDGGDAA